MTHDRIGSAGEERTSGLTGPASRRTLLKGLSFTGLAAGSACVVSVPALAGPATRDPQGLNYRETDHIRKYYGLARG